MGSEGGIDMTELKLEFLLEEPEIPAEVDRLLLSFLKASVEKYSPELFEKHIAGHAICREHDSQQTRFI